MDRTIQEPIDESETLIQTLMHSVEGVTDSVTGNLEQLLLLKKIQAVQIRGSSEKRDSIKPRQGQGWVCLVPWIFWLLQRQGSD